MKSKSSSTQAKTNTTKPYVKWVIFAIVTICILFAQAAFWISRTLFDTTRFTETTTQALTEESSRNAIASEITAKALQDKPVAQALVGQRATKLIAGLLDTNLATSGIEKLSERIQQKVTTENPTSVEINVEPIKNVLNTILTVSNNDQQATKVENIPNNIVIINADDIPNFYAVGVAMSILWPALLLIAVITTGVWIYKTKRGYVASMRFVAYVLAASSVLGLLVGPVIKPPVIAMAQTTNGRVLIDNISSAFLQFYTNQLYVTLILSVVIFLIGLPWVAKQAAKLKANF